MLKRWINLLLDLWFLPYPAWMQSALLRLLVVLTAVQAVALLSSHHACQGSDEGEEKHDEGNGRADLPQTFEPPLIFKEGFQTHGMGLEAFFGGVKVGEVAPHEVEDEENVGQGVELHRQVGKGGTHEIGDVALVAAALLHNATQSKGEWGFDAVDELEGVHKKRKTLSARRAQWS